MTYSVIESATNSSATSSSAPNKSAPDKSTAIKLVLVDAQPIVFFAIRTLLVNESDLVLDGTLSSKQLVDAMPTGEPTVYMLQLNSTSPQTSAAQLALLNQIHPTLRLLILVDSIQESELLQIVHQRRAACMYISELSQRSKHLIRALCMGEIWFSPDIVKEFVHYRRRREVLAQDYGLTKRELFVLDHLVEGRTNCEIADALTFSMGTARNYVSRIYKKLGKSNRSELNQLLQQI